jgi:hypothetical protein
MTTDPNRSFAGLTPFHLTVRWNGRSQTFPIRLEGNVRSVSVPLPFGTGEIAWTREADDPPLWRCEITCRLKRRVRLHQFELVYGTGDREPFRFWVPYLRPGPGQVIADRVFRTPVILVRRKADASALIPDLETWPGDVDVFLDADRSPEKPYLSHGIGSFKTTGHVLFRRARARRPLAAGSTLRISHFLTRFETAGDRVFEQVASFAWKRFARSDDPRPQVMPFARSERLATDRIFSEDLYRDFDAGGKHVGGMIAQTVTARRPPRVMTRRQVDSFLNSQDRLIKFMGWIQKYVFTHPVGNRLLTGALHAGVIRVAPMFSFGTWFNQARTALGVRLAADRLEDPEMASRAGRMVELALSAPAEHGLLPSICFAAGGEVFWKRGTRAFAVIDSFHLPDMATTGFHLLEWAERVEADPRIERRCGELARALLSLQGPDGEFPSWVHEGSGTLSADPVLARSAATAAPAMFLARWHCFHGDKAAGNAVKKALAFMETEVMPGERWDDYELLYSCASRPTGTDGPDPYTGNLPANTLGMYWTARSALDLWQAEGDEQWLTLARRALGRLSLYQQVWDHPGVSIDTFGGFAVMNADAEWNDARQGVFAPLYFDIYRATGEREFFERGLAAVRACYTTMLVEEHRTVATGNMLRRFHPRHIGSIVENYGHSGRNEATNGYLAPDWGGGTSLYASATAHAGFGDVYVNVETGDAFALDLCTVKPLTIDPHTILLEVRSPDRTPLELVVDHAHPGARVRINGREADFVRGRPGRYRWNGGEEGP